MSTVSRLFTASLLVVTLWTAAWGQEFPANHIYVTDNATGIVQHYDADGVYVSEFQVPQLPPNGTAGQIRFGPDGLMYMADYLQDKVNRFDSTGTILTPVGSVATLNSPGAVAFSPEGNLYVVSSGDNTVVELDPVGNLVRTIGAGDGMVTPKDLEVGPEGHLFVASAGTNSVYEYDVRGQLIRQLTGGGSLFAPRSLAFSSDGRLYVGLGLEDVALLSPDGTIADTYDLGSGPGGVTGMTFNSDGDLICVVANQAKLYTVPAGGTPITETAFGGTATQGFGLAVVPQRFKVSLSGHLVPAIGSAGNVMAKGTLSVDVANSYLSLAFDDSHDGPSIKALFGSPLTFHGFFAGVNNKGMVSGSLITTEPWDDGIGSLSVRLRNQGSSGDVKVKKCSASLHRSSLMGTLQGQLKFKRALN